MSAAYLNIPNDVDFNLAAMFGMIQSYLSVPGYTKTNGGLKNSLMKKVKNGRTTFDRAWKGLYDSGLLKRTRIPHQNNQFYDHYQLFHSAVTAVPAVRNMTVQQGASFMALSPAHYEPVVDNYTGVSRTVLEDPALKLIDKNLYILIRKLLLLEARNKDIVLSKEYIRYKSGLSVFKFNHAWKRLRAAGYLLLERSYDHINKHTVFLFSLPMEQEFKQRTSDKPVLFATKKKTVYQINREQIRKVIEERVESDVLRTWANGDRQDAYYYIDDVDKILIQITDFLCSDRKTFRVNGTTIPMDEVRQNILTYIKAEVVHTTLNRIVENPPTKNAKQYMLSILYNECILPLN